MCIDNTWVYTKFMFCLTTKVKQCKLGHEEVICRYRSDAGLLFRPAREQELGARWGLTIIRENLFRKSVKVKRMTRWQEGHWELRVPA